MTDIELIIKISKEDYEAIKNISVVGDMTIPYVFDAIRNGTPLPKRYGDLIDRQALINNGMEKGFCDWYDEIKYADAIIEGNL